MGYEIRAPRCQGDHGGGATGPNINIHGTGFAGSQYALGILAAWGCART